MIDLATGLAVSMTTSTVNEMQLYPGRVRLPTQNMKMSG